MEKRKNFFMGVSAARGAASPEAVFCAALREFVGAPYVWGGGSPKGSDCSGSVCAALSLAMGKRIRVDADTLFRELFTEDMQGFSEGGLLYAAFFLDGSRRAVHVAGWCGSSYVNVSSLEKSGGAMRTEEQMKSMYSHLAFKRRGMRI